MIPKSAQKYYKATKNISFSLKTTKVALLLKDKGAMPERSKMFIKSGFQV